MVYAVPEMTNIQVPDNSSGDEAFVSYKDGREVSSYTNGELANHARTLWDSHFKSSDNLHPMFMSVNLETPLAFTAFLANNANHHKVFIPSTFNMSKILNSFKTQNPDTVVVDQEFYELDVPLSRGQDIEELNKRVKNIVVSSSSGSKPGRSHLFQGAASAYDPYKLGSL